jgi:hypothetical protein
MSIKPSDDWCLSVCHAHHLEIHQKGEKTFFRDMDKARQLAQELYLNTGNKPKCLQLIGEFMND